MNIPFKNDIFIPKKVDPQDFAKLMTDPKRSPVKGQEVAVIGVLWKPHPETDPPNAGCVLSGDEMLVKYCGLFRRSPGNDPHQHATNHVKKLRLEDGEGVIFDYIALDVGTTYVLDRSVNAENPHAFLARVAEERNGSIDDFKASREAGRAAVDKKSQEDYQIARRTRLGVPEDEVGVEQVVPHDQGPQNNLPPEDPMYGIMNVLISEDDARVQGQDEVVVRVVRSRTTRDVATLTVLGAFPVGVGGGHQKREYKATGELADVFVGDMYKWLPWPPVGIRHSKHIETPYRSDVGAIVNDYHRKVQEVDLPVIKQCEAFYALKKARSVERAKYWDGVKGRMGASVCEGSPHWEMAASALEWVKGLDQEARDEELSLPECAFMTTPYSGNVVLRIDDRDLMVAEWGGGPALTAEDIVPVK